MRLRWLAPLMGLLLLAFGLRVAGLESQSIWVDEGFSVDFATRSASDMTAMWKARGGVGEISDATAARAADDPLAIAVDIHPPLYYLLLHEWLPLAGRGEYAVRFPSVMAVLLLVALLYRLGAGLAGRGVGLAAAGAGALAPFFVAYAQEARMYAPVALFGSASLYFAWRALRSRGSPWPWIGLVAASELALYTHYSAVLVIGAENLLAAGFILARRFKGIWRFTLAWAGAQLAELALFVPWLRTSIGQVAKYNENLWVPNWQHELTETFRAFDAGLWLPPEAGLRLAAVASAILLIGLAAAVVPRMKLAPRPGRESLTLAPSHCGGRGDFTAGLWFGGGALLLELGLALMAFQIRPEFHPRYLMVLATPYYVLLGLALAALWRRWRAVGLLAGAGLAAVFLVGLRGYEFDPNFAKDDTRTLAQYLAGQTTADDLIALDAPEPLDYYYRGPAKLAYLPGDEATVAATLTREAAGKKRIVFVQWFLSTSDPDQLMPFLLQKYGRLVDDHTFRGYRERTYAIPPNTTFQLTPAGTLVGANFANTLRLDAAGFSPAMAGDPQLQAQAEQPVAASGQSLMLALEWTLLRPAGKDYKATAYLTDERGHLGGQVDLLLRDGPATTLRWPAGEPATNYYVLQTLPGLMPGRYTLNVAVYPDGEQERLSVLDSAGAPGGGSVGIGSVDVLPPIEPADPASLGMDHSLNQPVAAGISLAGFDLPKAPIAQGDPLHLTLSWHATAAPKDGLQATLALQQPGQSQPAWEAAARPRFPTGQWRPGDVFRDWYDPALPPQLAPGTYQLLAGMDGNLVALGQVQVLERKRSFDLPSPSHPLRAELGGSIELLGYDQDKPAYAPGSTARITLFWRDAAPMADSYTAFVHILDSGRHVVAQVDSLPAHGQSPTNAWLPNEVVEDQYELPLKAELAPGAYRIETGFYRGDTGMRLEATSADVQAIDDGLLIGTLTIAR
jgi:4-amino-4-deoxy-L-arabinose transferase-like glycosyltransferase